jgi:hypothetical protein
MHPFSQGRNGRDHNPMGFSIWMADGGIKGGTVLHQVGIDHEDLTFRHGGRDMRLTDVHGNVMKKIIA